MLVMSCCLLKFGDPEGVSHELDEAGHKVVITTDTFDTIEQSRGIQM